MREAALNDETLSRLIGAVAARLKIRLDEADPAFVIVEINRLILAQVLRDAFLQLQKINSTQVPRPARALDPATWMMLAASALTSAAVIVLFLFGAGIYTCAH